MSNTEENGLLFHAGAALSELRHVGEVPYVVVPEGFRVESLEGYLECPARHSGQIRVADAASFITLVNDLKEGFTNPRVYGTFRKPTFVAVLNDHDRNSAGWRDFSIVLDAPFSVEWLAWTASSGKSMTQTDFAKFIEDNLPDIVSPPAAEMLEISRTLEAKKKINFASGIRLSNGQNELSYEEEVSGTASRGKLAIPEVFSIGIPVLEGGERFAVTCRLRYRIAAEGKLSMWYELIRPHKIVDTVVAELRDKIEAAISLKPIY